jgi:flagellin-like protein
LIVEGVDLFRSRWKFEVMRSRILAALAGRESWSVDQRGVSPVVGVVLMLGVTVVLGLMIGPAVFGTIGGLADETPDADFAFFYEEDIDSDRTDDFGAQVTGDTGLMVVRMESGESLDPGSVEVRSGASGGNLLTDTADDVYGPDDRLQQGDTVDIVAARGETVELIWRASDGDESVILASMTVPGTSSPVPPGVPSPTLGCDWVDSETQSGTLDVEQGDEFGAGDVVACDSFDSIADSTVDIEGDLTVVADIDADSVTLRDGSFAEAGDVYGSIESSTDLDLAALTVTGPLTAGGELDVDTVTVEDDIDAGGPVEINDSTVDGDVVTGGDLTLESATVTNHVEVADSLTCSGGSTIAGEDCTTYRNAKFDISVTATTWPGIENETLRVVAVAENVRIDDGDRELSLVVDGTTRDTVDISALGSDESEQVLLSYEPANGSAGDHLVSIDTNETDRDDLDSRTVAVEEDHSGLPTVHEFTTTPGGSSITVDWNVSAGTTNLSAVTVELYDADGEAVGEQTWFLDGGAATGSETFDGLAPETHSITLDVSDQGDEFVREIAQETPT